MDRHFHRLHRRRIVTVRKRDFLRVRAVVRHRHVLAVAADQFIVVRQALRVRRHRVGAFLHRLVAVVRQRIAAFVHIMDRHFHRLHRRLFHRRFTRFFGGRRLRGHKQIHRAGKIAGHVIDLDFHGIAVQAGARVRRAERVPVRRVKGSINAVGIADLQRHALKGFLRHLHPIAVLKAFIPNAFRSGGFPVAPDHLDIQVAIHGSQAGQRYQQHQQCQNGSLDPSAQNPFHPNDASFWIHRYNRVCFNFITNC